MKKQNIETIIKDLFLENFTAYEDQYTLNEDGTATNEASELVADVAKDYWANRQKNEIDRDENAGVTEIDYIEWCMDKFSSLIPEATIAI